MQEATKGNGCRGNLPLAPNGLTPDNAVQDAAHQRLIVFASSGRSGRRDQQPDRSRFAGRLDRKVSSRRQGLVRAIASHTGRHRSRRMQQAAACDCSSTAYPGIHQCSATLPHRGLWRPWHHGTFAGRCGRNAGDFDGIEWDSCEFGDECGEFGSEDRAKSTHRFGSCRAG